MSSSQSWEDVREVADRMAERWRTTDVIPARDFAGGVHANLLAHAPGDTSGPPTDAAYIILCDRGERRHRQWQDGKLFIDGQLRSGDLLFIPAGVTPRAVVIDPLRILHVYVPTRVLCAVHGELGGADPRVDVTAAGRIEDPLLRGPMRALADALNSGEPLNRLWLDGIGLAICARAVQRWSNVSKRSIESTAKPARVDWRTRRAIEFMEAHIADDMSLQDIAAEVGLTATHLATLFRLGIGEPPHRYLMRRRCERACELLCDPRRSITEIAHVCGFASSQHLATVFHKRLGVTPSAYRRERLL